MEYDNTADRQSSALNSSLSGWQGPAPRAPSPPASISFDGLHSREAPEDTIPNSSTSAPKPTNSNLVNTAAKSCINCRVRRVKCDRIFPHCDRCKKRRETCAYKTGLATSLQPRRILAPEKIDPAPKPKRATENRPKMIEVPVTTQLPAVDLVDEFQFTSPVPNPPEMFAQPVGPALNQFQEISYGNPTFDTISSQTNAAFGPVAGTVSTVRSTDWNDVTNGLGEASVDWRLGKGAMANSLMIHLLDASMESCCSHLPAFRPFAARVNFFKTHLHKLDSHGEIIVNVLASLGARASPHSAIMGVAESTLHSKQISPELAKSAGQRRENAWRAIADRAVELCGQPATLQFPSQENVESLVAVISMLKLSETSPHRARFFLRVAVGMFCDLQQTNQNFPAELNLLKKTIGPTIYESDARVAAFLCMPLIVSDDAVRDYWGDSGVILPDLARDSLALALDEILTSNQNIPTQATLDSALSLTAYFVCAIQRKFAKISSAKQNFSDYLDQIPQLWDYIDNTHSAVQRLHREVVGLQAVIDDAADDHFLEFDLLIGVRLDSRLIDVINLIHAFLLRQTSAAHNPQHTLRLNNLLSISERRVRKCLKLLAFYSKVFVDSRDKHLVYHMFVQLDCLPQWVEMAPQQIGEPTISGPLTAECALAEKELDWFTTALELTCFFSPLANEKLKILTRERQIRKFSGEIQNLGQEEDFLASSAPKPNYSDLFDFSSGHISPETVEGGAKPSAAEWPVNLDLNALLVEPVATAEERFKYTENLHDCSLDPIHQNMAHNLSSHAGVKTSQNLTNFEQHSNWANQPTW